MVHCHEALAIEPTNAKALYRQAQVGCKSIVSEHRQKAVSLGRPSVHAS